MKLFERSLSRLVVIPEGFENEQVFRSLKDSRYVLILFFWAILFVGCSRSESYDSQWLGIFMNSWAEQTQTAALKIIENMPPELDENQNPVTIQYGEDSPDQNLDLYFPDGEGPFPLIVFIHGGGWRSGSKNDGQEQPWVTLTQSGYAVASVNYRLAPGSPWPTGLDDCGLAIEYLTKQAPVLNLDPDRIGVAGSSSGGHYALMLLEYANERLPIQCAAVWYPVTDIPDLVDRIKTMTGSGQNERAALMMQYYIESIMPAADLSAMQEASPITWVHSDMGPVLLQHGDNDILVDCSQSQAFYETCLNLGIDARLDLIPSAGHADAAFQTPDNIERVRAFFDECLKQ